MRPLFKPPAAEIVAELREQMERPLSPEEYRARSSRPVSAAELEEMWSLIDWFIRRYPSPLERLAYARRMGAVWHQAMPVDRRQK